MKLSKDDTVVAAWAEPSSGMVGHVPLVWALVRAADGKLRTESVPRELWTQDMTTLFHIASHVTLRYRGEAEKSLGRRKR